MLLLCSDPAAWDALPVQRRDEVFDLHAALMAELRQSGEFMGGAGLAEPASTKTTRASRPEQSRIAFVEM